MVGDRSPSDVRVVEDGREVAVADVAVGHTRGIGVVRAPNSGSGWSGEGDISDISRSTCTSRAGCMREGGIRHEGVL